MSKFIIRSVFALIFTTLFIAVTIGTIQNVVSKASKYSMFDPTKEMTYIPLDEESKIKGKAAIDVVGSRLGKSGSAWLQIFLIELGGVGSILSVSSMIIPFLILALIIWFKAINSIEVEPREAAS